MSRGWNVGRLTVVALLAWGAYWAFGFGIPAFPAPPGGHVLVGAAYLVGALWVVARRPL